MFYPEEEYRKNLWKPPFYLDTDLTHVALALSISVLSLCQLTSNKPSTLVTMVVEHETLPILMDDVISALLFQLRRRIRVTMVEEMNFGGFCGSINTRPFVSISI